MREDDDGEEERMCDLQDTGFEVLDAHYHVGGGSAFAVAGCDAVVYVVREHDFPAPGVALFADVAFAVDEF